MLAKLKLLKTSKGIDSILMLSGVVIVWITTFFYPHHIPPRAAAQAVLAHGEWQPEAIWLAFLAIALTLFEALRPGTLLSRHRTALRILAFASILVPLTIYLLSVSTDVMCHAGMACPDIGSCWWLLGVSLFWLPAQPRMATLAAGVILLCGLLLGVRSSQSFSYTLWSAWIAAYILYLLYRCHTPDDALA